MSFIQSDALKRARATIENSWEEIAEIYTVAWMGPIEAVEAIFDHITNAISDIRPDVSRELPCIIYQSRESPPKKISVAVPYVSGPDGYKCRLVASNKLITHEMTLLAEFAQALWFLIDTEILPSPADGNAFAEKLIEYTDRRLIEL